MSDPVGRPQGGFKSDAGKTAYWRLNYESAIGALADLIAEHTETVETQKQERAEFRAQVEALPGMNLSPMNGRTVRWVDLADVLALLGGADR